MRLVHDLPIDVTFASGANRTGDSLSNICTALVSTRCCVLPLRALLYSHQVVATLEPNSGRRAHMDRSLFVRFAATGLLTLPFGAVAQSADARMRRVAVVVQGRGRDPWLLHAMLELGYGQTLVIETRAAHGDNQRFPSLIGRTHRHKPRGHRRRDDARGVGGEARNFHHSHRHRQRLGPRRLRLGGESCAARRQRHRRNGLRDRIGREVSRAGSSCRTEGSPARRLDVGQPGPSASVRGNSDRSGSDIPFRAFVSRRVVRRSRSGLFRDGRPKGRRFHPSWGCAAQWHISAD